MSIGEGQRKAHLASRVGTLPRDPQADPTLPASSDANPPSNFPYARCCRGWTPGVASTTSCIARRRGFGTEAQASVNRDQAPRRQIDTDPARVDLAPCQTAVHPSGEDQHQKLKPQSVRGPERASVEASEVGRERQ